MTAVITVNEGEFGVACVFSTAYDMSGFSTISMKFTKPDNTTLLVTNADGVTVPAVPVSTPLGTFGANTYAQYFFKNGDLDQIGIWSCRVIFDNSGASPAIHLISNTSTFTVTP